MFAISHNVNASWVVRVRAGDELPFTILKPLPVAVLLCCSRDHRVIY